MLSLSSAGFYILLFISFHVDQAMSTVNYIHSRCNFTANYTAGSVFEDNMQSLFSTLTTEAPPTGFANSTAGQGSDKVYGLVQCRGDVDPYTCKVCIDNCTKQIVHTYCPKAMDAIIWYEKCQLRYSSVNFFGRLNVEDSGHWHSIQVDDPKAFDDNLGKLLKNLTSLATTEPSGRMFATGNIPNTELQTIFGLVQCTRDIRPTDCRVCLDSTISKLQTTCHNGKSCEIATGSCRVEFDTEIFYTNVVPTSEEQQKSAPAKPGFIIIIIIISVLVVVFTTSVICGICWWRRDFCCFWRKKLKPDIIQRDKEEALEQAFKSVDAMDGMTFDLATVRSATNDFAPRNKLGQGGFGAVYRGQLPDGQEIAVKKLSLNTKHGPKQFENEVKTLAKVQHRNLVRLLGGFLDGEEKILIYEYVRHGSLDKFLFEPTKRMQLDWEVRSKLINGIARGLSYLHEDSRLRIVHRDLKAGNVLLDEDMNPKISDFGTAKIFDSEQTQADTREIVGTREYMAPEYLLEGKVSLKIDVFSFGVLLLEIVTGKENKTRQGTDETLLNYVWRLWMENKALQVVDEILEETGDKNEILRCIHIGLLCVQEDASSRPKMSKVVAMLENSLLILPSILPPAPSIWNIRNVSLGPQTSSTTLVIGSSSDLGSSSY